MPTSTHTHLTGDEPIRAGRASADVFVNVSSPNPFDGHELYLHLHDIGDAQALEAAARDAVAHFEEIRAEQVQYALNLIHTRAADNRVTPDVLEQMLSIAEDEVTDGGDADEVVNRLFREPPAGDPDFERDCAADERYHREREAV